jgi:hypothetical protein
MRVFGYLLFLKKKKQKDFWLRCAAGGTIATRCRQVFCGSFLQKENESFCPQEPRRYTDERKHS